MRHFTDALFDDLIQESVDIEELNEEAINVLEKDTRQKFDPPYNAQQIKDNYGEEIYKKLSKDPAHS